jgi:chromosome segregation ATPase
MENEKIPREVQDSINARADKYFKQDPFIGLSRKEAEEMSYISGAFDQYRLTAKSRWKKITESTSPSLSSLQSELQNLSEERDSLLIGLAGQEEQHETELQELRAELDEAKKRYATCYEIIAANNREIKELRAELERMRGEKDEYRKALEDIVNNYEGAVLRRLQNERRTYTTIPIIERAIEALNKYPH